MKTHHFHIGMHQRYTVTSLRAKEPHPDAHRGMWAFNPDEYPDVDIGDKVVFENNGKIFDQGRVTGFISFEELCRRLGAVPCSGLNRSVILWD